VVLREIAQLLRRRTAPFAVVVGDGDPSVCSRPVRAAGVDGDGRAGAGGGRTPPQLPRHAAARRGDDLHSGGVGRSCRPLPL